ncbi:hypothetical protein [Streptomyces sp. NBC_00158]|uniref:hypothetical protein n=1 Tax=Streptomyces sp. NBC_00158 TaxID=2903627 RepID=UPI002F911B9E
MTSSEAKYLEYLLSERRAYAWVMRHHGGLAPEEAEEAASKWYEYRPPEETYRDLVFHEDPWHWAMVAIHGDWYMVDHPELAHPSPEYPALD